MAELESIAEMLRRHRQDLEEQREKTLSRRSETADLVGKIEDLLDRVEQTQRRFQAHATTSRSSKKEK